MEYKRKLAENLNLSVDISKEFHPFALSTSFWCKTEALKPLLDYKFKIKDLPENSIGSHEPNLAWNTLVTWCR